MTHFGSLNHESDGDDDQDGLSNSDEMAEGTDPNNSDTDGDGIPDGQDAVATDPDIKIPRYPVPVAYAVTDLKEFVPTNLNDLGQMAGYWDDGSASEHFIDGIPGVWSNGEFYPFSASLPTHNFSEDPDLANQHGPIIDEWTGTLMGIDNQGNLHFTDFVDLASFDSEEDLSFVASSHFNGETFEPIVAEGADNYRSWQEVVQVSAGGGVLTGGFVEFSWTSDDHGHRIVYRMSGASGTLQGMPDGNDRDDLTFPNGSGVYHNSQGWDDLIDGGSFSINSSGQTVGTIVDYFGTTSVGDITSPYHNPERGTAHAIAWGFSPTAKMELPGSDHPGQYYGMNDLKIVTGKTDELGATIWLGAQNLKRKALPLAPGTTSHDFSAGTMNNHGQMLTGFPGISAVLWQNTRLFPLQQLVATSGYKNVIAEAINTYGTMIGSAQNADTGESKRIALSPAEVVTIQTFIPHNNVDDPRNLIPFTYKTVFAGDNRLIGSPARAKWNENGSHRTRQRFNVVAWRAADANGLQDNAYANDPDGVQNDEWLVDIGTTREFDKASSLDASGNLTAAALADATLHDHTLKVNEATASKATVWIDKTEWIGDYKVAIYCKCSSGNPLVSGAGIFGPITYNFTISIDRSDPAHPKYSLSGDHDGFPAYEVYINHKRIYEHDPLATGEGLGSLGFPSEHSVPSSKLNQSLP